MKRNRLYESILRESEDMFYVHYKELILDDSHYAIDIVIGANSESYFSDSEYGDVNDDFEYLEPMPKEEACALAGFITGFDGYSVSLKDLPHLKSIDDLKNLTASVFEGSYGPSEKDFEPMHQDAIRIAQSLLSGKDQETSEEDTSKECTVELVTEKIPVNVENVY